MIMNDAPSDRRRHAEIYASSLSFRRRSSISARRPAAIRWRGSRIVRCDGRPGIVLAPNLAARLSCATWAIWYAFWSPRSAHAFGPIPRSLVLEVAGAVKTEAIRRLAAGLHRPRRRAAPSWMHPAGDVGEMRLTNPKTSRRG